MTAGANDRVDIITIATHGSSQRGVNRSVKKTTLKTKKKRTTDFGSGGSVDIVTVESQTGCAENLSHREKKTELKKKKNVEELADRVDIITVDTHREVVRAT